jgi:UDP-N-acetylglucosamine acyltransferase
MPQIHSTAILEGDIALADDVVVGPHCVLEGDITIGSGTRLIGNVYLTGKLAIGERNVVYPFSCIGFAAQDVNFPHDKYEPGIVIGDDNTFREGSTVHRATQDAPTTIGNDNMFMTTSHVGHDCQVANNVTIVTYSGLGGHVHVQERVIIGGGTIVHQFVSIGTGAMLGAGLFVTQDIPPFFMLTGINIVGSVNLVGMRRGGMDGEEITRRKDIFKLLYRSGNTIKSSMEVLEQDGDVVAMEYVEFAKSSRRGLVPPQHQARSQRRGMASVNE